MAQSKSWSKTGKLFFQSNNQEYYFKEGCYIQELLNDAGDPDASIARARLEPAKTTRWHKLSATTERYVILQGTGRVEINQDIVETVSIGDIVFIPADAAQRIVNTGRDDLIFLAICTPRFQQNVYQDMEGD